MFKILSLLCKQEEYLIKITVSDKLYDQLIEFKEHKIKIGKYKEKTFIIPTGKCIKAQFLLEKI